MSTTIRCTYCLATKPPASFGQRGDHVIPASIGGGWVDSKVCDCCNGDANRVADQMIATDALVQFLRDAYQIAARRGATPEACKFSVPVPEGGVIDVTLEQDGFVFTPKMAPAVAATLDLGDPPDQRVLAKLVAKGLGLEGEDQRLERLTLARAAQEFAAKPTPPPVWSRFMAKLGLACGRDAYGDSWLDSRQATILSHDLLGSDPPRFSQRTHYPPVEPVWPYEPPRHQLWIERHEDTAVLMIVLFGQVLGAVPVSDDVPPAAAYTAWCFDPRQHSFRRSSFPAVWLGAATARITQAGSDVVGIGHPDHPFIFVPDGPSGPVELPIPTTRADSPTHALQLLIQAKKRQDS